MRATLILFCCALSLGCGERDPDAPVYVTGAVNDTSGAPVAGARVELAQFRPCHSSEALDAADAGVVQSARSTADGLYAFTLVGAELDPRFQTDDSVPCLRLSLRAADGGLREQVFIGPPPTGDIAMFPLIDMETRLTASPQPDGLLVSADPLPPPFPDTDLVTNLDGSTGRAEVTAWELWSGDVLAYTRFGTDPLLVTPELTEDFGPLSLSLRTVAVGSHSTTPALGALNLNGKFFYSGHRGSDELAVASTTDVPISRGAPCWVDQTPVSPCPWTDGSLQLPTLASTDAGMPQHLVIALPRTAVIRRVIIRGLPDGAALGAERSLDDGATWQRLPDLIANGSPGDWISQQETVVDATLPPGTEIRWLRLSMTMPVYREVSLFE